MPRKARSLPFSSSVVRIHQSVCVLRWSSVGDCLFIPRYVCEVPTAWEGGVHPLCLMSFWPTRASVFFSTVCDMKRSSLVVFPVKHELSWCLYCYLQGGRKDGNTATRVVWSICVKSSFTSERELERAFRAGSIQMKQKIVAVIYRNSCCQSTLSTRTCKLNSYSYVKGHIGVTKDVQFFAGMFI